MAVTLSSGEAHRLHALLLNALGQSGNAGLLDLGLCLAGADVAVALGHVELGLGVGGDDTLEVTQDDLVRGLGDNVVGHNGGLAAAAGSVDHEGGNAVAGV